MSFKKIKGTVKEFEGLVRYCKEFEGILNKLNEF
jgi:hypothetical protein